MAISAALLAVALAVVKVVLVCAGGAWLGRRGILDAVATRRLSQVIFHLLLPCLLVSKISGAITWDEVRVLWILPVMALFYVSLGFVLGQFGCRLLRPPAELLRPAVAAVAFPNSGYLPMTILTAMATTVPQLSAIDGAGDRAIALISIYLVGFTFCLWGLGFPYLSQQRGVRWDKMLSPPLLAMFVGLLIGLTPLRGLLHGAEAPLAVLGGALEMLGMATLPCAMLVLGGNLAHGPSRDLVPVRVTAGVVVLRLLLMPLLGLGLVLGLLRLGLLPREPLLLLVLLMESAAPSANNLVVISEIHGHGEKAIATILFWSYLLGILSLTLYGSVFVYTVFSL